MREWDEMLVISCVRFRKTGVGAFVLELLNRAEKWKMNILTGVFPWRQVPMASYVFPVSGPQVWLVPAAQWQVYLTAWDLPILSERKLKWAFLVWHFQNWQIEVNSPPPLSVCFWMFVRRSCHQTILRKWRGAYAHKDQFTTWARWVFTHAGMSKMVLQVGQCFVLISTVQVLQIEVMNCFVRDSNCNISGHSFLFGWCSWANENLILEAFQIWILQYFLSLSCFEEHENATKWFLAVAVW